MKKIILVEGCDKSGKSTIIRDLQKIFPQHLLFKNNIKPEDNKLETIGKIAGIYLGAYQASNLLDFRSIYDRCHLTEIVYSYRRGYESSKYFNWLEYEEQYLKDACIIYMTAPKELIKFRFKTDNETYIGAEEIESILDRYEQYLKITKLPVLRLSSLYERDKNLLKTVKFLGE
jgi:thymidylate kinase